MDIDWWLKNEAAVTNAGWSGLAAQLGVATLSVEVAGVKPATATGKALSCGDAVAADVASMEIAGPWSTARRSSSCPIASRSCAKVLIEQFDTPG
ncbi:hypothetical protein [Streptomyces cyaneochromogenes]|uniref:hypothetical protein n=1 Tax=Streptomyces cyaneochromogenes TaxID=2496836 RepID=UPI001E627D34|nr:hypothetical protein [Streptomyces cyaneochromogenes]